MDYLADAKPPRFPQTKPMSIGSAFDAYVKSALHNALFGVGNDPQYELQTLFEAQVEPHNRDWALVNGKHAFECYKKSGCYADMLLDLKSATGDPQFEVEIRGVVEHKEDGLVKEFDNMVLLGKPDLFYKNKDGFPVILDWKVNGWCAKSPKSPEKGYIKIRHGDGATPEDPCHKKAVLCMHHGVLINVAHYLEDVNTEWAAQLAIYGWLLGQDVGGEFITCIDQFACSPSMGEFPNVRIAEHRTRVSPTFQRNLYKEAQHVWDVIHSNHIFRNLSLEESQAKCNTLDAAAQATVDMMDTNATPEDKLFAEYAHKRREW